MLTFFLTTLLLHLTWCEHESHIQEDHRAFLGRQKDEFDNLSVDESRRRLRLLVPHIDMNKDGFITADELEYWVRKKYESLLDDHDPQTIYREADTDFNGKVDWQEYMWRHFGIRQNGTDVITEELKKEFATYILRDERRWKHADQNNDNMLNDIEFHMFAKPYNYNEMLDIVAQEELEEIDSNNDGVVSLDEYLASLHMPDMKAWDENKFNTEYDLDKDGQLNLAEIKIWKTPELFDKSKLEAKHLIEIADDNKDGQLSSDEILAHHFVFVGSKVTRTGSMIHDEF